MADRATPKDEKAPAIAITALTKSYGKVEAVRNLSLEVPRGQIFGFLGLNGAGKTTTIRVLLDLLRPTSGSARVFGLDCREDSRRVRALTGYLPGELGLYGDMSGEELLSLTTRLSGRQLAPDYRLQLAERLELSPADLRRKIREYSSGMKRKLGLIQAMQHEPELLILDEPTEGLDPLMQRELNRILLEQKKAGRTIFMSSHVMAEVERVCDRIAVIRKGELAFLSTVAEARKIGGRRARIRFEREVKLPTLPSTMRFLEGTATEWLIRVDAEMKQLLDLLRDYPIHDLEIGEPELEDVLERYYREERA